MSGPCPGYTGPNGDISRLCQVHDWPDFIDYLHSSPAALAVALTAVLGFVAFLTRPAVDRVFELVKHRSRRRRLLAAFGLEVANSAANLEAVYSDEKRQEWMARFDEAAKSDVTLVPFQTYSESDFMNSSIKSELPEIQPAMAELIVRHYANDALLGAATRDLRSESYRGLTSDRQKSYYGAVFTLAAQQIETCHAIKASLAHE